MEHWIKKGYGHDEAKEEIRKVCDTSLSKMIKKYGKDKGTKKYNEKIKKISNNTKGKNNPMFGRPSPNKSGSGFSGWYKKYYLRSTFEYFAIKRLENEQKNFVNNIANKNLLKIPINEDKNYYPDILIPNEKKIIEIKAKYNANSKDTIMKKGITEEKLRYGKIQGYKYHEIWTEDDFNIDINILRNDYEKGIFKIDDTKRQRFENYLWKK